MRRKNFGRYVHQNKQFLSSAGLEEYDAQDLFQASVAPHFSVSLSMSVLAPKKSDTFHP